MLYPVPQDIQPLACGPTAMCALTGESPGVVLLALHRYMKRPGSRPIVGVVLPDVVGALALLGYRSEVFHFADVPTFGRAVRTMKPFKGARIVCLTGHMASVTYDEYLCTHTEGKPVPISEAPNKRRRIHGWIKVTKL